jgi:hypothetical protein
MRSQSDEDLQGVSGRSFCIPRDLRQPRIALRGGMMVRAGTNIATHCEGGAGTAEYTKALACTQKKSMLLDLVVSKCAIRCIRCLWWCRIALNIHHRGLTSNVNTAFCRIYHACLESNLSIVFGVPHVIVWAASGNGFVSLGTRSLLEIMEIVSNLSSKRSTPLGDRACALQVADLEATGPYDRWPM